jgi:hypothetical protein
MKNIKPDTAAATPTLEHALSDDPIRVEFGLPPSLARRLRALAYDEKRSPGQVAAWLVSRALVPDARERARLVSRDLRALGVDS